MDEMNPAFENFLNNMSRLGGTPRETTRRVSASSFLGKDIDIERRVNNNSKKISVIARILKSRRANTIGIEKSILDINYHQTANGKVYARQFCKEFQGLQLWF